MNRFAVLAFLLAGALVWVYGCSDDHTGGMGSNNPPPPGFQVSVRPVNGAVYVSRDAAIVLTFNRSMMGEPVMMESIQHKLMLHQYWGVNGARVEGTVDWNGDYTVMTFRPREPLAENTTYTVHFQGAMAMDSLMAGPDTMMAGMDEMMACMDRMMGGMGGMMDSMMADSMMMNCMQMMMAMDSAMTAMCMLGDSSITGFVSVFSTGPQIARQNPLNLTGDVVLVANGGSGNVTAIDPESNSVLDTQFIDSVGYLHHLYYSPDRTKLLVSDPNQDLSGGHAGGGGHGGHHGGGAGMTSRIVVLDSRTLLEQGRIVLDGISHNAVMTPDGAFILLANAAQRRGA